MVVGERPLPGDPLRGHGRVRAAASTAATGLAWPAHGQRQPPRASRASRRRRIGDRVQERLGTEQQAGAQYPHGPGRVLEERGLHGMQGLRRAQPFHGLHAPPLDANRELQAGGHRAAVHEDGARAAAAGVAARLRTRPALAAQQIDEARSSLDLRAAAAGR